LLIAFNKGLEEAQGAVRTFQGVDRSGSTGCRCPGVICPALSPPGSIGKSVDGLRQAFTRAIKTVLDEGTVEQ
jgi:hypothetical protein